MANAYCFYLGKNQSGIKQYCDLEEDIFRLVGNFATIMPFMTVMAAHQPAQGQCSRSTIRVYEIPSQGTIITQLSTIRDRVIGGLTCDGIVHTSGFDQSAEPFKTLDARLRELAAVYSVDRSW